MFRYMAPKPSSQSVLPRREAQGCQCSHPICREMRAHLDCLLGGWGWPSGVGRPAGLEKSLSPSLWTPHLGLQEPEICACGHKDRTLPVSSTLTPQHGPWTSWGKATTRALIVLQPRMLVGENLPLLRETGSQQHKAYLQTKKWRSPEAKPSVQGHMVSEWQSWTESRAVCSQSTEFKLDPTGRVLSGKEHGSGPGAA